MGPELLVIAACLNGTGCNESYSEYYRRTPELQLMMKNAEGIYEANAPKVVTNVLIPMIAPFAGIRGNINIGHNLSIGVGKDEWKLNFNGGF